MDELPEDVRAQLRPLVRGRHRLPDGTLVGHVNVGHLHEDRVEDVRKSLHDATGRDPLHAQFLGVSLAGSTPRGSMSRTFVVPLELLDP
jgi:hypothetical protein